MFNFFKTTVIFLISFIPLFTLAHVKWFAEESGVARAYKITDMPVIVAILLVLIVVGVGVWLDRKIKIPVWFQNKLEKIAPSILSIASIGFGLSFIIFSLNKFIFAPNLPAFSMVDPLLLLQFIAGVMILFGVFERVGGLFLIILFLLGLNRFGLTEMMDTFEMLGFAFYAMIIGRPKWHIVEAKWFGHLTHHIHEYGVSVLRVATGINLIILGFSEKILKPALTENFLLHFDWNFMSSLGMSDYWFAFSAGVAEIVFGIFFLFGLVTRITILCLAVFLVLTLTLLGPLELMGHLPHFSIALVLLVFGAGSRLHQK